jgi:hypothetical protein
VPDLIPAFSEEAASPAPAVALPAYGSGFRFDFRGGEFVLDPAGRVAICEGAEAWAVWCVKACLTERGAHAAYDPAFGVDLEPARQAPTPEETEAELARAIREALLYDERTADVEGFQFDAEGDSVQCSFTVVPVVGTPRAVSVRLTV